MNYTLSLREGFLSEWLALVPKEQSQIMSKLQLLIADPRPDGATKKQLKYVNREVYRLRSGDYRVFYTFDDRFVSLLKLVRRDNDTYDDQVRAEYFRGPAADVRLPSLAVSAVVATAAPAPARTLPRGIDVELLSRLHVPPEYHPHLVSVRDEDALLGSSGIPDEILLRVHSALFERSIERALEEKELVAAAADDLFRYRDGDLLAFLLRLSPEQEKYVSWSVEGRGPTLVKGGPGTGKSTVGLYRVRAILESLRRDGDTSPRVLFTTYTNALVTFSEHLLRSLLGDDARFVDVRTADSVALSIVSSRIGPPKIAAHHDQRKAVIAAIANVRLGGSSLVKRAQLDVLAKLGPDYVLDEINGVIDARRLSTFEEYCNAARPGRRVPLPEAHRRLIWAAREAFHQELKSLGRMTFSQVRAYAAQLVEQGHGPTQYDAIVIDEAQDLDPALLWTLVSLAKAPNRVFLTADANQSIYGSGFRWSDVHEQLQFKGRTGVLRSNFRSTREIGEAARAYLMDGSLEFAEEEETEYVHSGPLPIVRHTTSASDEQALFARFFRDAARELRLPLWAGALLVPTEKAGRRLAADLDATGVPARFMTGRELDLKAQAIKVVTLKSAKGLEFPFVALAGFEGPYPYLKSEASADERDERIAQERRTLFVGMTRAMRALMLAVPQSVQSELLRGFDTQLWNIDRN